MLELSEIASLSSIIRILMNGIRFCSVHVPFESGKEYRIVAFGDQTEELHPRAWTHPMYTMLLA